MLVPYNGCYGGCKKPSNEAHASEILLDNDIAKQVELSSQLHQKLESVLEFLSSKAEEENTQQQWIHIAAVLDRILLIVSIIYTMINAFTMFSNT